MTSTLPTPVHQRAQADAAQTLAALLTRNTHLPPLAAWTTDFSYASERVTLKGQIGPHEDARQVVRDYASALDSFHLDPERPVERGRAHLVSVTGTFRDVRVQVWGIARGDA